MKYVSSPWKGLAAWSATACIAIGLSATAARAAPPDPSLPASPQAVKPVPAASPTASSASPVSSAQADAGEPRANTSADSAIGNAGTGGGGTADTGGGSTPGRGGSGTVGAGANPPANGSPRTGASSSTAKPVAQKAPAAADRLDLGTATVTGDREQPKVMYVVPWKSSDIGDLSGKPMNSLLDEALTPVDRDEFKREVAYYDAVKADRSQDGTAKPAANRGEQ